MRYRLYRVHKYVCYELAEFERLAAKADFSDPVACEKLSQAFQDLSYFMKEHASFEDAKIHQLLRDKNSTVHEKLEQEHQGHDEMLPHLESLLEKAIKATTYDEQITIGNEFYLAYRLFYSEMLKHLYDEETIILPELQRLYSDEELAALQAQTYAKMTPEDMLGMLEVIFPHTNAEDQQFFLKEIKAAEPEKFAVVWEKISQQYDIDLI